MDIYDRISIALKHKNITRKDMCDELGISYHTLNSLYKRRTERIPFQMVKDIANYLNEPVEFLVYGDDTSKDDEIMKIFLSLSKDQQKELIDFAKYLQNKDKWDEYEQ